MMELPARLFPPALLAGLIVYGAATMLWLQPIVEKRLAEKRLIPQCEASLQYAEKTTSPPNNEKFRQAQIVIQMYENSPLGNMPGVKESLEAAKRMVEQMRPQKFRMSKIDRSSICGCAVDTAFDGMGLKMTLHVASLRTHTPKSLGSIDQNIMAIASNGQCGALPWK
ncbi:hypothetical protein TRICHSKD4_0566 [Roseibium sp. TrichSKD4]|uniref:hypothetical protein n=1 Tax=Roseibium sp. TrichSKD4 TaxID=744980 RepID=UPI0001E5654E|nr:hypothetical protein [Roseibium sp. TrichSKD4]EFO34077.1 hypothetical protein TRICHSKD4_0566 [Roseibium sp. TrichSKD4]